MGEKPNQRAARFYDHARWLYPLIEPFLSRARGTLMEAVNAQPAGSLLDIGVGTGAHLGGYCGHRVTGVDVSPGMVHMAARHGVRAGAEVCLMDGERLAFADAAFDHVVMAFVLSVTAQADVLLSEAWRVLRPGGMAFVLNHETPPHPTGLVLWLRKLLHLHSTFRLSAIPGWPEASVVRTETCGPAGVFTFVVLRK